MKTVLIVLIVLAVLLAASGIFFVFYALKRHKLNFEFPQVTDPIVLRNIDLIQQNRSEFEKKVTPVRWTVKTSDNLNLAGDMYPNKDSHKYVIVVHGYTSCKEEMLAYGSYFYDWGYNVLAPDNRAHGESEGKWIGMGWLDSKDHLMWIDKIIEQDPQAQITMLGVSMGGATVMMLSGLDLPSNVKCLIEDCGYSSVWDEFVFQLKEMFHLPAFPFLYVANIAAKLIAKYDLKEASSLERLKNAKVPMLFIHGTEDTFVPYEMLDKNIEAYQGPYKEVLRVDNATHGEAIRIGLPDYLEKVHDFVNQFIQ